MVNKLEICIEIQRPVEEVFAFASNVANLPLYDKGIRDVKKITEGPIDAGTTFHLIASQFGIRMIVVLVFTAYEPSHHFVFRVNSGPFPVETHYSLVSHGSGTQMRCERELQPSGIWRWLIPLMSIPAGKKFERELNSLKKYVEQDS